MIPAEMIEKIISETGTPAYLYDGELLRNTAREVADAFSGLNPHYSFKANPNIEIARILLSAGFGAEVSSECEARAALLAGFNPERIMYDGPAKTESEINHALSSGITHFNAESRHEIGRISRCLANRRGKPGIYLCLRVNPYRLPSAGEVMTGQSSRFGIDEEILPREAKKIAESGAAVNGIHLYAGSQILRRSETVKNFRTGLSILSCLLEKGFIDSGSPPLFTFGPGLGISYRSETASPDFRAAGAACSELAEKFRREYGGLTVKTEIGRLAVARSGIYVSRVVETKISRGRLYILVDGGIHHFMRRALTGDSHRAGVIGSRKRVRKQAVICGATCTPYDILTETTVYEPNPGALIAVLDAGAYGWSMGMANFLSRPTPPEIMADRGGWRPIRKPGGLPVSTGG